MANRITDTQSIPNWGALAKITDPVRFRSNHRYLTSGDPCVRDQMLSPKQRKLITPSDWEDLVDFAIYAASIDWDPTREKKCPLKNYAWQRLRWVRQAYWVRHKHLIGLPPVEERS
jgi:hypothetical protein